MEHAPHPRPMRRAKREVTDPAALRAIIDRCQVVRIAAHDDEGLFIMPLNFGYEWDLSQPESLPTFWLHSATEGRKVDAWRACPDVALEMDIENGVITGDYSCAYSFAFESVMAWGRIVQVHDDAEKRHGLNLLMEHMAPGAPVEFSDTAVERIALWRVDVERVSAKLRQAKKPHPHA